MDFGITSKMSEYYLANLYQKGRAAGAADSTSFLNAISSKAAEKTEGLTFEEMWKSRYPGAYYHVMDGSKISQGAWDRNDFPFEKFFSDDVDESILDWRPTGPEPSDFDPKVISRRSSVAGQKAIIVPPALEEKMKNDPEFAKKVMANVENFLEDYQTYHAEPGCSYLVELTEDGEIGKYRVTGPLRITVSSSEFVEERKAREAKHAEYERIAEKNALKRKLLQDMVEEKYYKSSIAKKAASASYDANVLTVPIESSGFDSVATGAI